MAVPKFYEFYEVLLQSLKDGEKHKIKDCREYIKDKMKLQPADIEELNPGSGNIKWINRIGWCIFYLKKAGIITSPEYATIQITDEGKALLAGKEPITKKLIIQKFSPRQNDSNNGTIDSDETEENILDYQTDAEMTPEEIIGKVYIEINSKLSDRLLAVVREMNPFAFEQLTVELMSKMGYEKSFVTRRTRDGGVDGVIYADYLGLECIAAIQAKRYAENNKITDVQIRNFIGSLEDYKTKKGIFITTSEFTPDAIDRVKNKNIILIDGKKLVELMIKFDIGVVTEKTYVIKKIDKDYFTDDEND